MLANDIAKAVSTITETLDNSGPHDDHIVEALAGLKEASADWKAAGGQLCDSLATLIAVNQIHGSMIVAHGDEPPAEITQAFTLSKDLVDLAERAGFVVNDPEPSLPSPAM
ncbi:conserved hypothetical protein [Hyphomicrobiales bacterium]|nr:conserved hypothetical protein [Hyphomicrobiales bacterium]CAH1702809.1 hypothetical protein BOSEA1005_30682 [Hyphomicrobiales bacterium]CAI0346998.1 hypothetical protein BO1005MUT1_530174 [Hyphomicrobiales bacterium]